MQQEIFGPVLPVLTYESLGSAVAKINSMAHPLALYLFTSDEKSLPGSNFPLRFRRRLYQRCPHPSGNQQYGDSGGFGESGMGSYHGIDGFRDIFRTIRASWIRKPGSSSYAVSEVWKVYEKMVRDVYAIDTDRGR